MGKMEEARAFAIKLLKKNPELTQGEARQMAQEAGITIYPAIMSAARAELGIKAKRGARAGKKKGRKKTARKASGRKKATRKRGRPAAAPAAETDISAITDFIDMAKRLETEVKSLRSALAKIRDIANEF